MRSLVFSLGFCLLLGACTKVQDSSTRALDTVEKETSSSWYRIRDYLDLGSRPPVKPKSRVQPRYCYGTLQDVICYPSPVAGQEGRLLAYQNSAGTGYTLAPHAEHAAPRKKTPKVAKAAKKASAAVAAPVASGPAPVATMPEMQHGPTPAPSPVPAPVTGAMTGAATPEEPRKLKEITFDPSELEPKKLVPDRLQ